MKRAGFKQVGWRRNPREVGRGDPLGFGTVWISLLHDSSGCCGKKGRSLWSRGQRREDEGEGVCRRQRSTRPQLVFSLTLSSPRCNLAYTPTPGPHAHTPSFLCLCPAVALVCIFSWATSEDRFFRITAKKGEVPLSDLVRCAASSRF